MNHIKSDVPLSTNDWIALSLLDGIGPSRLSRLFTYFESLQDQDSDTLFSSIKQDTVITHDLLIALKWPKITAQQAMEYLNHGDLSDDQMCKFEATLEWLSHNNRTLLTRDSINYPEQLRQIKVAPAMLFVEGTMTALTKPCFGIVGARKCVLENKQHTFDIAYGLASTGYSIVSGGAIGVDTQAHYGAMKAGADTTVAVMGTGLSHLYPRSNIRLFNQIIESHGCIISEYPLSSTPRPHFFPPRNRIISGLSLGVLVAQASLKSGSLISANYALEQNRDVFAMPSRVNDEYNAGGLSLLKQGAILTTGATDILEAYPSTALTIPEQIKQADPDNQSPSLLMQDLVDLSQDAKSVFSLICSTHAMDFDELIKHSGYQAAYLMQVLMELELAGVIKNHLGSYSKQV